MKSARKAYEKIEKKEHSKNPKSRMKAEKMERKFVSKIIKSKKMKKC